MSSTCSRGTLLVYLQARRGACQLSAYHSGSGSNNGQSMLDETGKRHTKPVVEASMIALLPAHQMNQCFRKTSEPGAFAGNLIPQWELKLVPTKQASIFYFILGNVKYVKMLRYRYSMQLGHCRVTLYSTAVVTLSNRKPEYAREARPYARQFS